MQASLDGGEATTIATGQDFPYGIAVDETSVYWTNIGPPGAVMRVAKEGGQVVVLAGNQHGPDTVVVGRDVVAWNAVGRVWAVPLAGGEPVALSTRQEFVGGIAVDGENVFWTDYRAGTVMGAAMSSPLARALAKGLNGPFGIAFDAGRLFWTTEDPPSSIMRMAAVGGTPDTLATAGEHGFFRIVVDETSVYWTSPNGGTVMKAPR